MELQTISEVSKQFNISTRTLRYYEQIGLLQSTKKKLFHIVRMIIRPSYV